MPWKAVSEVVGCWLFGSFCDIWIAFDIMCSTASILNLCIISLDRYWAISSPFRYERKMTQKVAFIMIGMAWSLSILISFIPVRLNWHRAETDRNAPLNRTTIPFEDCTATLNRTYAIASSLISFYIPVIIMIGTYTRIYRIAQTQIRRISTLEKAAGHNPNHHNCTSEQSLRSTFKKETKVLKTLSIIMGVFVFCWLPFFVLNCIVPFCDLDTLGDSLCVSSTTFNIFVWFGWANSSLNPVIYACNADFRKAFTTILGCNRLCAPSAVETVNFSNELVSYHHDTTLLQKDAVGVSNPQRLVLVPGHAEDLDIPFDKVSVMSDSSRIHRNVPLPALEQQEGEMEISLDMMPFTSTGLSDCCVIPGQIEE
ncbi:D(5)-like dopamine receptor [Myxocyprinus asiaticus]|uniref:D(5)-like dopamine receptor n=1 Tax=Myxocyprinus asiaticus TaxID=70543 RepID=UPI002222BF40|nr:D(5)-like dopamine receptor [Myxocyprinus asiaticus]